jgi:hypothetical protein
MYTHRKSLTIAGALLSMAVVLALPLMNGFKSTLYSILADVYPVPPAVTLTDGEQNTDNDWFGYSVDISGDYAIVGAIYDDNNGYSDNGAAYIFYNNPADNPDLGWVQQKKLIGPGYSNSHFGAGVGIDGVNGRAIVGAPHYYYMYYGIAYIYYKNNQGINQWGQQAQIYSPGGYSYDFGKSIDIDGDYAVIGDPNNYSYSGRVYVLKRNYPNADNWNIYKQLYGNGNGYTYFGYSVAIDGDNIIIGEYGNSSYQSYAGAVYIFHKDYNCADSDCWGDVSSQHGVYMFRDADYNYQRYYYFLGRDVDIDGNYAIAGTYENANRAYLYRWNGSSWVSETSIYKNDNYFGVGVAVYDAGNDKVYAAVGSLNNNAYMYARDEYGTWN